MKKLSPLTMNILIILFLAACANIMPDDGIIDPGEKVGDFLISTGTKEDTLYLYDLKCEDQGATSTVCQAPAGQKINVSLSVFDPSRSADMNLDTIWADHTYHMKIEGRPVNLDAFGSIDAYHVNEFKNSIKMRHWNIWILTDKPGEIKIQNQGNVLSQNFDLTVTYKITAP